MIKLFTLALLAAASVCAQAQDKIASNAKVDIRMKDVRNVHFTRTISADLSDPASDIYTDWDHQHVSKVSGHVPANFKIDLRGFCMPTPSRNITSQFGPRWRRQHEGLDIKVYTGDTIRSAFDGRVRITRYDRGGYGYFVVIRHPNGLETLYGHLSKIVAKEDQIVKAGDVIGLGGNTGRSTGSHLHFETRLLGKAINPALLFDFANQDVTADFYTYRSGAMTKGSLAGRSISDMEEEANRREGAILVSNAPRTNASVSAAEEENEMNESSPVINDKQGKSKNKANRNQRSVNYKVKSGDTLSKIARQHGTTVQKLCKLNGLSTSSVLRIGQSIKCS